MGNEKRRADAYEAVLLELYNEILPRLWMEAADTYGGREPDPYLVIEKVLDAHCQSKNYQTDSD